VLLGPGRFDKAGTLTEGKRRVADVVANGLPEREPIP
jgi:cation transport ATPase